MTTSVPAIILAGSVSQGNEPMSIAEDYAQLITDTSAFTDSGSKTLYLDSGTISEASPAQIGRVLQGTTITAATVQANQDILNAIGVYCRDNGISIQVAASLDLPSEDDWTYQWLAPAVDAGLPITAVEDVNEETLSVQDTPSNWATLATEAVAVVKEIAAYYPSVQIGWWETANSFAAMANQWNAYDQAALTAGVPTISYIIADTAWNTPWVESSQGWLLEMSQMVSAAGMKLDVLIDGTDSSGSDLQWTAQSEQHAEMLASIPGMTVNALIIKSWNSAYPNTVLPVDEPTTVGNDAAEIAATYPLYQAGAITAQDPVVIDGRSQVITTINQSKLLGSSTTLVWGPSDLETNASVGVVIIDQTGILSAAESGAGTVTGSGSQVLVLSGDATDLAAELNSLTITEPVSGPDTVDVEVFGVNGRVADAQIGVLTLPAPPTAQGQTYEFTQQSAVQQWTTAIATVNQSRIVASETLYWNKTGTNPLTGAYQAMDVDSIHEPLAESGVILVGGIVEEPLANPPAGAYSLPFVLPAWNSLAFNAGTQLSTINVLQTTMSYGPQSGHLESVTDILAPTVIPNSALPSGMVNYLATGGTQVTQINSGDNPNWLPDWSNQLASVTTTDDGAGTVIEQSFQGGATEPYLTVDNVFDPLTGVLWEQIETLPPPSGYGSFVTGDELVTEFNTGNNPNWDYVDWGDAAQVTVTFQDFYAASVSLNAPVCTGTRTTNAYISTGSISPDGQLSITGSESCQTTSDTQALLPFATVVISDTNIAQTETLRVTLSSPANGSLSKLGGGSYNATTGVYTDTGSAAAVTTALGNLVFTPTPHEVAPGQTVGTTFTVNVTDTAGASVTASSASVIVTTPAVLPTISGMLARHTISDTGTLSPFATVAVSDANFGKIVTLSLTLSNPSSGSLSNLGGGTYNAARGIYTVTGSSAEVTISLDNLIFTPRPHMVAPGQTVATIFSIKVTDSAGASVTKSSTGVIATAGIVCGNNNNLTVAPGSTVALSGTGEILNGSSVEVLAETCGTCVTVIGDGDAVTGTTNVAIIQNGTNDVDNLGAGSTVNITATNASLTLNGSNLTITAAAGDAVIAAGTNDLVTFLNGGTITEIGTNCSVSIIGSSVRANLCSPEQTISATGSFDVVSTTAGATIGATGNNDVVGSSNSIITFNGLYGVVYGSGDAVIATAPATSVIVFGNANTVSSGNGDTITISGTADVVNGSNTVLYSYSNSSITVNGNNDIVASIAGSSITLDGANENVYASGGTVNIGTNASVNLGGGTNTIVNNDVIGAAVSLAGNATATINGNAGQVNVLGTNVAITTSNENVTTVEGSSFTLTGSDDTVILASSSSMNISGSDRLGFIAGSEDSLTIQASPGTQTVFGFNPANGDQIDLSQILVGVSLTPDLSNIGNYLSVLDNGSNTSIFVAVPDCHDTVLLSGVGALSLQNLFNDHALYFPSH